MVGTEEKGLQSCRRPCVKSLAPLKWKDKLRENCFKRVREDRNRLLWKLRLSQAKFSNQEDFIKSTLQDIVSDELQKIKEASPDGSLSPSLNISTDDMIWEYDGLHTACQGDCEEILLEMQRIFYEDLKTKESRKEPDFIITWEDEEDEYLSQLVYNHMLLNSDQIKEEVWCPICKQGKLLENGHHIYCINSVFSGSQVDLNQLRVRLGEAHSEHFDRGCKLRPEFCVETKFGLTALYIKCQGCNTFEIIL
ncbi:Unknown protein [Striga hermonthica]|uniref:RPA-interacting protein n=1 Tax=Striga hermonthica TaxID=68872 RepID=A0A9N7NA35_STRHE|nr:Unknown protein [Striga hermonthica]